MLPRSRACAQHGASFSGGSHSLWRSTERLEFGDGARVCGEAFWAAGGSKPEQSDGFVFGAALESQFAAVEIHLANLAFLGVGVRVVCCRKRGLECELPEIEAEPGPVT
jgi:hypothetical protein